MSAPVVNLAPKKGDAEFAQYLREYADRVESGDITEFVFVGRSTEGGNLIRCSSFEDRWRLLGALEYGRAKIASADDD